MIGQYVFVYLKFSCLQSVTHVFKINYVVDFYIFWKLSYNILEMLESLSKTLSNF